MKRLFSLIILLKFKAHFNIRKYYSDHWVRFVEPQKNVLSPMGIKRLLDEIWPVVGNAALPAPKHARIARPLVIVAVAGEPFVRSEKGTNIRRLTLNNYEDEIEMILYVQGGHSEVQSLQILEGFPSVVFCSSLRFVCLAKG
jgi:hypothetical protein